MGYRLRAFLLRRLLVSVLEFFGGIVGLHGACLNDDGGVAFLVVLALVRNRPRHVTTLCHYHARHNDRHNQNLFHILSPFIFHLSDFRCKGTAFFAMLLAILTNRA